MVGRYPVNKTLFLAENKNHLSDSPFPEAQYLFAVTVQDRFLWLRDHLFLSQPQLPLQLGIELASWKIDLGKAANDCLKRCLLKAIGQVLLSSSPYISVYPIFLHRVWRTQGYDSDSTPRPYLGGENFISVMVSEPCVGQGWGVRRGKPHNCPH